MSLREETGARIGAPAWRKPRTGSPISFPPGYRRSKAAEGWLGQKQIWFAFRFTGEDSEFDLSAHERSSSTPGAGPTLDEALDSVADFKRDTYRQVIETFRPADRRAPEPRQAEASGGRGG